MIKNSFQTPDKTCEEKSYLQKESNTSTETVDNSKHNADDLRSLGRNDSFFSIVRTLVFCILKPSSCQQGFFCAKSGVVRRAIIVSHGIF